MSDLKNKVIVTAALTGAVTPAGYNIPETPEEIAQTAYECWKLGAAVVHLHMRDDKGIGTMDAEKFKKTIELLRGNYPDCDVVINCTSSGAVNPTDEERMEHMKTIDDIEIGSFDAGTFNWMPSLVFMNTPKFLEKLSSCYLERGIKPEVEIFDSGMFGITNYYVKKGLLKAPVHYQFCLGVGGGMDATVENLLYLVNHIPDGSTWSAFGVGKGHLPILYATLALGGNIRVGLEDNVVYGYDKDGKKIMATNQMLVQRAIDAIKVFGKEPATSAEAREILGLKPLVR